MFTPQRRSLLTFTLSLVFALSGASSLAAPFDKSAPLDFKLRTADGGEISSEMLRGDIVVLAFGVRVYWVSTDSDSLKSKSYATDEQLRAFARKNGLKVAVLRDPDGALFKQVGVPGNQLPAVVILDRRGNVSGESIGGLDPKRKLIETLSPRLNQMIGDKTQ